MTTRETRESTRAYEEDKSSFSGTRFKKVTRD